MTEDFLIDEEGILERVDEYTLYCHYLGFVPDFGMKYTSPIRPDDSDPSFGIFAAKKLKRREYGWKDQGNGESGDIFRLIQKILALRFGSCTYYEAIAHIKSEFGLGPQLDSRPIKLVQYSAVPKEPMEIKVKARSFESYDFRYWEQSNINDKILEEYFVKPIRYYFTYSSQTIPKFPKDLGYWYYIHPKNKLYFPYERKEFKFRNDMTERELEGFAQLKFKQNLLVITKSYKDVMSLASFGYEAVCARAESILIPQEYLTFLESKYKHILILFDNDGKHKANEYVYDKVFIPLASGTKDVSDYCKQYGPSATANLLNHLL